MLPDGSAVTLRPIRARDMGMEQAFVRNLSPESRFFRFMGEVNELSPPLLHRFTHPDHSRESAYVLIRSTPGGQEQIGVGRIVLCSDGISCEFAIVIADAWQGHGLARRLLDVLMRDARERGLRRIEGFVLASNLRMLEFVRRLGFEVETAAGDAGLKRVYRDLDAAA